MNLKTLAIYPLACTLLFSCVTRKKYDDLTQKKSRLETEKAECDGTLQSVSAERDRLNDLLGKATVENTALKKDSTEAGIFLRTLQRNYAHLNETYEKLLKNQDRLQSNSAAELSKRERELLNSERQINELKGDLTLREEKLKELEKVLADKDRAVNELKDRVSKALLNFKEKDLTVNVKNGKVYVSLNEQLLFKSGSTEVDPKGAEALKKLSEALRNQDDVSVMVEGHTDDVPVGKLAGGVRDNWDLSVLRATSITKILVSAGLSPSKVVPSGRGEFSPIAEGKTAEARQKNRRTEIILTPKLDELFKLLDNK